MVSVRCKVSLDKLARQRFLSIIRIDMLLLRTALRNEGDELKYACDPDGRTSNRAALNCNGIIGDKFEGTNNEFIAIYKSQHRINKENGQLLQEGNSLRQRAKTIEIKIAASPIYCGPSTKWWFLIGFFR